jgi:hypothetical protein
MSLTADLGRCSIVARSPSTEVCLTVCLWSLYGSYKTTSATLVGTPRASFHNSVGSLVFVLVFPVKQNGLLLLIFFFNFVRTRLHLLVFQQPNCLMLFSCQPSDRRPHIPSFSAAVPLTVVVIVTLHRGATSGGAKR